MRDNGTEIPVIWLSELQLIGWRGLFLIYFIFSGSNKWLIELLICFPCTSDPMTRFSVRGYFQDASGASCCRFKCFSDGCLQSEELEVFEPVCKDAAIIAWEGRFSTTYNFPFYTNTSSPEEHMIHTRCLPSFLWMSHWMGTSYSS